MGLTGHVCGTWGKTEELRGIPSILCGATGRVPRRKARGAGDDPTDQAKGDNHEAQETPSCVAGQLPCSSGPASRLGLSPGWAGQRGQAAQPQGPPGLCSCTPQLPWLPPEVTMCPVGPHSAELRGVPPPTPSPPWDEMPAAQQPHPGQCHPGPGVSGCLQDCQCCWSH